MGRSLAQIFKDADAIIEKRASESAPEVSEMDNSVSDDNIFKLAEAILNSGKPKEEAFSGFTRMEKIAYAKAILDAILNHDKFDKLASFEKSAVERGLPQEEVDSLIKKATTIPKIDALLEKTQNVRQA